MKYDYSRLVASAIQAGPNKDSYALGVLKSIITSDCYTAKEARDQARAFLDQFKAAEQSH